MSVKFKYNGTLWIEIEGEPVFGPGRVELLERIQQTGSIRQAAIQMGMSYRQAWQMVEHMNSHLSHPVVISQRGGKGGGNAEVTQKGMDAIKQFKAFHLRFHQLLAEQSKDISL
ncbi:winged helix-turn-helix domain-containing protein [Pedobacter sp. L105]|uniref:winged helix-turn-helix domain-containing protein n=1 Tax=Pedobacter sp. L105 TaxID=1641871 RepID=UPI00131D6C81|nr:winged helix-turn-helix domain-containing protein [Pedobacter sp. L105]